MRNAAGSMVVWCASLVSVAGTALAGPLVPQQVAPGANWVVHFDMEAFNRSALGAHVMAQGQGTVVTDLAGVREQLGFDPLHELKAITLSGVDEEDENAVVVLTSTQAIDEPLGRIASLVPNYRAITEGARTIHSWGETGDQTYAYVKPGANPEERLVMFSGNLEHLRRGMLRLEGAAPVEPAPALRGAGPGPGTFVYFSALDLQDVLEGGAAGMLSTAESIVVEMGEAGPDFFARASVVTATAEDATTNQQIVLGLMAMARLALANNPQAQPFAGVLGGFSTTTEGSTLRLNYQYQTAELLRILGEAALNGGLEAQLEGLIEAAAGEPRKGQDPNQNTVEIKIESKSESKAQ